MCPTFQPFQLFRRLSTYLIFTYSLWWARYMVICRACFRCDCLAPARATHLLNNLDTGTLYSHLYLHLAWSLNYAPFYGLFLSFFDIQSQLGWVMIFSGIVQLTSLAVLSSFASMWSLVLG